MNDDGDNFNKKELNNKETKTMPKNYYYDMSIFKNWLDRKMRRRKVGQFTR